ncbi:HD-GYP domain-containing protein [Duganella sp. HH101]|uniref:HD-GYP domain-containing protein n=1 Tax=Duganella sp. HH101 TaxID=1781066 RepID=UPI000875A6BD|nr:HD domain-containing phosphohydrolase [Duganella sp. HH101]OFA05530.1 HD domain protein [Duganella sp. HH101]
MKIRKVTAADLKLGMLIPWNVYGENGALLVRKGHMIASANQIDYLVERGSFEDHSGGQDAAREPDSALRKLNAASLALQTLLPSLAAHAAPPDLRRRLEEVALLVADAVAVNVDAATATLLHNQTATPYAVRHSIDTAVIAQVLAKAKQLSPEDTLSLTLAALTMNVAMLAQHQRLQDSRAEPNAADRAALLAHPEAGVLLLRQAGISDQAWLDCILYHHENEDGSGYPLHKSGAQIPPLARLLALADRYAARVAERVWRKTLAPHAALRDLLLESNVTIDGNLVTLLIRELGIYPIGTWVRLINGEIGVVSRRGLQSTTPHVTSVIGPRGAPLELFLQRDTRGELHAIREVLGTAQVAALQAPPLRMEQVWGRTAAV